jgi:hypothetical protein
VDAALLGVPENIIAWTKRGQIVDDRFLERARCNLNLQR